MSATDAPRVLMLGAGAVGMTYGYHLEQGGASVTYFVKPKYQESVLEETLLYPLNRGVVGRCQALPYRPTRAISSLEDLDVASLRPGLDQHFIDRATLRHGRGFLGEVERGW